MFFLLFILLLANKTSYSYKLLNDLSRKQHIENASVLIYVGTYTGKDEVNSKGIYAFIFDSNKLSLKSLGLVAITPNPTYLLIHPSQKYILSINEINEGKVNSFKINSLKTGQLTLINQESSYGSYPIYISTNKQGQFIFVANYMSGTVSLLPFDTKNGFIQPAIEVYQQNGSSIDPESQISSHPHCILLDKKEEYAISADLGSDELYIYRFISTNGTLKKLFSRKSSQAGDGPRHLIFSNDQNYVYLMNELTSTIIVFKYYYPILREIQTISTLPENFTSINYGAELLIHPISEKFLYASNRGHDSIVVFQIDNTTGHLTTIQHISVQGQTPRSFNILPNGNYLIVANQDSNNLIVFSIDQTTGKLTSTNLSAYVNKPTSIKFIVI